jgi:hypothetical protein
MYHQAASHPPTKLHSIQFVNLQDEHAESKVYTRKLEARLEELKGAADLSSKLHVAKSKVCNWLACLCAAPAAALRCSWPLNWLALFLVLSAASCTWP